MWRSSNGKVRLTMTEQLWAPIRALLFADPHSESQERTASPMSRRSIFNTASLDIRTAEGLRTAPAIQRGISELFESMRVGRKLTLDEFKQLKKRYWSCLRTRPSVTGMDRSHILRNNLMPKGAASYFALKGLLAPPDLWDDHKPQRAKSSTQKRPLPSQPDIGDGMWLPSQHASADFSRRQRTKVSFLCAP